MEIMKETLEEKSKEPKGDKNKKRFNFNFGNKFYILVGIGSLLAILTLFGLFGRKEVIMSSSDMNVVNRVIEEQLSAQKQMNKELLKEIKALREEIKKLKGESAKKTATESGKDIFNLLKNRKRKREVSHDETKERLKELEEKLKRLETKKRIRKQQSPPLRLEFKEREVKKPSPLKTAGTVSKKKQDKVFIPAGSVFKGRIVSGFFAPVGGEKKFPVVLIQLKGEAVTPNGFRVPLDDCRVIAKAEGDWVLERARLQTYKLACVIPSGRVVEVRFNANVVSGIDGMDGVKGKFVNASAKQLRTFFGTTFLGTFFDSLARAQVRTFLGVEGGAVFRSEIIENDAQYAFYRGLAETWKQFSQFYLEQAKQALPVVLVDGNIPVYLQVIDGFSLEVEPHEMVANSK